MNYDLLLMNIERDVRVNQSYLNSFPIGLHSIASFLNDNGFRSFVYSNNLDNIEKFIKNEINSNNIKVIGFYCGYDNESEVISVSNFIKSNFPYIKVIIGGPQTIAFDYEEFIESKCDVVVIGEGELTALELMFYYIDGVGNLDDIDGIKYLFNNNIITNKSRKSIENLDILPFAKKTNSLNSYYKENNIAIITGRGCPFNCSFCYEGNNTKRVRLRTIENVMKEIDIAFEENPKIDYIIFLDDTFTLNIERLKIMCSELKKRREKHNFNWFCEGHVKILFEHKEIIPIMLDAGLTRMQLGIESGSNKVLEKFNKKITKEQIEEVISELVNSGIKQIVGNFILGGCEDSSETIKESIDFAKKLLQIGKGIVDIYTVFFAPYPNTAIVNNPEYFSIKINDIKSYKGILSMIDCVTESKYLSKQDLYRYKYYFDNEIKETIKEILSDLNFETLLHQFNLYHKSGIFSKWLEIIMQNYELQTYFSLIVKGNCCNSTQIKTDELVNYRPIRTFNIKEYVGKNILFKNEILSDFETQVIEYSSGKITIKKMTEYLAKENKKSFESMFKQVKQVLDKFEEKYYIIYSKF